MSKDDYSKAGWRYIFGFSSYVVSLALAGMAGAADVINKAGIKLPEADGSCYDNSCHDASTIVSAKSSAKLTTFKAAKGLPSEECTVAATRIVDDPFSKQDYKHIKSLVKQGDGSQVKEFLKLVRSIDSVEHSQLVRSMMRICFAASPNVVFNSRLLASILPGRNMAFVQFGHESVPDGVMGVIHFADDKIPSKESRASIILSRKSTLMHELVHCGFTAIHGDATPYLNDDVDSIAQFRRTFKKFDKKTKVCRASVKSGLTGGQLSKECLQFVNNFSGAYPYKKRDGIDPATILVEFEGASPENFPKGSIINAPDPLNPGKQTELYSLGGDGVVPGSNTILAKAVGKYHRLAMASELEDYDKLKDYKSKKALAKASGGVLATDSLSATYDAEAVAYTVQFFDKIIPQEAKDLQDYTRQKQTEFVGRLCGVSVSSDSLGRL